MICPIAFETYLLMLFCIYFQISRYIKMTCSWKNYSNRFCYICIHEVFQQGRADFMDFVKKAYHAYLGLKTGHHLKPFAPQMCCETYVENLRD